MKKRRIRFQLKYPEGQVVRRGDRVLALGKPALIEAVFEPRSKLGRETVYGDEGGFILQFDDGDRQVWLNTQDEIKLIERGKPK